MKRCAILLLWMLGITLHAAAQSDSYKVVFDLTSKDSLDQKAVVRWIKEIVATHPKAELEVVMYGKGFELVMPERSTVLSAVKDVAGKPNVTFAVCEMALKNNKVEKANLLNEVRTVPDGIYEIISKQREGWGYIKVGH
jgi:intracellular sulfur oxidation DsrE/DsrF family protein